MELQKNTRKFGTRISEGAFKVLGAVALNGAAATRTFVVDTKGMTSVLVGVVYTYGAATDVTLTPYLSQDGGTTYTQPTEEAVSGGVATLSVASKSISTGSANQSFNRLFSVSGADKLKIVVAGGGSPTASDKVDVYATGIVE